MCLAELEREQPGILKGISNGNPETKCHTELLDCRAWLHHWVPLGKTDLSSINRNNNTNYCIELWR